MPPGYGTVSSGTIPGFHGVSYSGSCAAALVNAEAAVGWVVAFIILFVAVAIMYFVLSKLGVFHSVENTVGLVTASKAHAGANAASWFAASRVLGYTMLVGAVNVILITALATVGAVLYNLVTMLAGGIEVTLKETD